MDNFVFMNINGNGSELSQVMACRLFRAKPLPELMLFYCQLDLKEQISVISVKDLSKVLTH